MSTITFLACAAGAGAGVSQTAARHRVRNRHTEIPFRDVHMRIGRFLPARALQIEFASPADGWRPALILLY
jgi:hypothetical protein